MRKKNNVDLESKLENNIANLESAAGKLGLLWKSKEKLRERLKDYC